MAHFALIEQDVVREVLVIGNDDCGGGEFPESEPIGQAFIASCGISGNWLQTSYHGSFRGSFAGIGFIYDPVQDIFKAPDLIEE